MPTLTFRRAPSLVVVALASMPGLLVATGCATTNDSDDPAAAAERRILSAAAAGETAPPDLEGRAAPVADSGLGRTAPATVRSTSAPRIERRVPSHAVALLRDCSEPDVVAVAQEIGAAIEVGAPLYNDGNHEACYRIYEGASLRLARDLPQGCRGAAEALEAGIARADGLETMTEKAWAMRDAFDGLHDVIGRRLRR